MRSEDYPQVGRGWSFPVRWHVADDGMSAAVELADGEEKIRQSLEIILKTGVGERVMRPTFGAGVYRFVFEPRNDQTIHQIRFDTERALRLWEPRVIVDGVAVTSDESDSGRVLVTIEYRIDRHRRSSSLVLPFYRMGQPDE